MKKDLNKLRFYYADLNNYTREFLIEIVLWQKEKLDKHEGA